VIPGEGPAADRRVQYVPVKEFRSLFFHRTLGRRRSPPVHRRRHPKVAALREQGRAPAPCGDKRKRFAVVVMLCANSRPVTRAIFPARPRSATKSGQVFVDYGGSAKGEADQSDGSGHPAPRRAPQVDLAVRIPSSEASTCATSPIVIGIQLAAAVGDKKLNRAVSVIEKARAS